MSSGCTATISEFLGAQRGFVMPKSLSSKGKATDSEAHERRPPTKPGSFRPTKIAQHSTAMTVRRFIKTDASRIWPVMRSGLAGTPHILNLRGTHRTLYLGFRRLSYFRQLLSVWWV